MKSYRMSKGAAMHVLSKRGLLFKAVILLLGATVWACSNGGGVSLADLENSNTTASFKFSNGSLISTDVGDEWAPVLFNINGTTHMYYLQGDYDETNRLGDANALLIHVVKGADGSFTPAPLGIATNSNGVVGFDNVHPVLGTITNGADLTGASLYLANVTAELAGCSNTLDNGFSLYDTTTGTRVDLLLSAGDSRAATTLSTYTPEYNSLNGVAMRDGTPYLVLVSNTDGNNLNVDPGICLIPLDTTVGTTEGQLLIGSEQAVVSVTGDIDPNSPTAVTSYSKTDFRMAGIIPYQADPTLPGEHLIVLGSIGGTTQIYMISYNDIVYGQADVTTPPAPLPAPQPNYYGFKQFQPGTGVLPLFNQTGVGTTNTGDPVQVFTDIAQNMGVTYDFVGLTHIYVDDLNIPLPIFTMADPVAGSNANFFFVGTTVNSEQTVDALFNGAADDISPWFEKLPGGDAVLYFSSRGRYIVDTYDLYRANHPTVVELMANIVDVVIGDLGL